MIWLVVLVLLHTPDGADVVVSANEVVSMRGPRAEDPGKHFTPGVHCLINTTDGKYVAVKETCVEVMRIFVDTERAP
jgi:hypothetical protein